MAEAKGGRSTYAFAVWRSVIVCVPRVVRNNKYRSHCSFTVADGIFPAPQPSCRGVYTASPPTPLPRQQPSASPANFCPRNVLHFCPRARYVSVFSIIPPAARQSHGRCCMQTRGAIFATGNPSHHFNFGVLQFGFPSKEIVCIEY